MLEVLNLACQRGDRLLFRQLGFTLQPTELLRVTGPNGSGKTSLLRILCGLGQAAAGEVHWQGENIQRERETYHATLLYLGHAPALNDLLTPLENLRFAAASAGQSISAEAGIEALTCIGLARQLDLPCKLLSQGQRRRVGLARLFLAANHSLWILDEPFTALDPAAVADMTTAIAQHAARGGMAIFTTHQDAALPARALNIETFTA